MCVTKKRQQYVAWSKLFGDLTIFPSFFYTYTLIATVTVTFCMQAQLAHEYKLAC